MSRDDIDLINWTKSGERVCGRVVDIRDGRVFDNRTSRVAELRRSDGSTVAVVLTRLLDEKFEEHGVHRGDRIRIKYLGWRTAKYGRRSRYRKFKLDVL